MRAQLRLAAALTALLAPGCAMAENVIRTILPRPADCTAKMTVQRHGCSVLTILQCGSGATKLWRTEAYGGEGLDYVALDSTDGRVAIWADSSGKGGFFSDTNTSHMTPFAEVAASGSGDSVMSGTLDVFGAQKPMTMVATLTRLDPPLILDGVTFTRIAGNAVITMSPPMPKVTNTNVIYFDPASGVAFEGESEASWPPPDGEPQHTPAAIILPGQPGFDQTEPTYDCGNLSWNLADEKAYHA